MTEFEDRLFNNLKNLGIYFNKENLRLGAAVSGGADSVSLLVALSSILKPLKLPLFVINVNHNIRESSETLGDSLYVRDLCKTLQSDGCDVRFFMQVLAPGKITELSLERKSGTEEAARFCRYQIFEDFISSNQLDFLCLAHNQNDNLETALMRFLQGGFSYDYGVAAIPPCREKYIRPLLNVSRSDIEAYLAAKGVSWRTDSTNLDPSYLRNNIRLSLVPFLDSNFSGWKTALLNGMEKARLDNEMLKTFVEERLNGFEIGYEEVENGRAVFLNASDFLLEMEGVQIRLLTKMINLVSAAERIPFAFLREVCEAVKKGYFEAKVYKNVVISLKNNRLTVKNCVKSQTDFCFSVIIEEEGSYAFHFGKLDVLKNDDGGFSLVYNKKVIVGSVALPICVRSLLFDDEVLCADGKMKKVRDVLSQWHVPESEKGKIPLVQQLSAKNQRIICIFGEVLGFDNWIIK